MSDKQVTLTIDGREINVAEGTLVIRAAEQLGIYVPRFCDHPYLAPLGACRQCMVEIEGQRKPLTSCTTMCTDGMVVKTQFTSEVAQDAQESVLEFLLINHPLDCPQCDKGGECPLQDQTLAYGPGRSRFTDVKRRFVKPVPVNPLVYLDRERCVLCARCTRFADEISGDPFIELFERGALEQVAIFEDDPYESNFSGNVIQICPVGALTSRNFRFRARPFDMTSSPSVCNLCASGCSLTIQERRGQIVRVLAGENPNVNDAWSCDLGRFGHEYVSSPDRITEPMIKKDGEWVAVSWAEAIRVAAGRIESAKAEGAPVGVLAGQNLCDEDAYALSRFARTVLQTNDVDHRLGHESAEHDAVIAAAVASESATNRSIDEALVILVAGIDLYEESPIVFLRVKKAARAGAKVLEVNARRTPLSRLGGLSVLTKPGEEAGAVEQIAAAVEAAGDRAVILCGDRLGPGAMSALWNLGVRTGASFGWVPRKGGAYGAVWAGLHPMLLPGGRRTGQAADVERVWATTLPDGAGRPMPQILSSSQGVLLMAGVDPVSDGLDPAAAARGLDAHSFVIALDMFMTPSTERADVILPVAAMPEREGTRSNWEGRAQAFLPAVDPAGLSSPDWEILGRIAAELHVAFPRTLDELRREMQALRRDPVARVAVDAPGAALPAGEGFALVTYRLLRDSGTMMAGADELKTVVTPPFVELHPADATRLGITDGDTVTVTGPRGSGTAVARVGRSVSEGAVFVPADQPGLRIADIADPSAGFVTVGRA
ncbi:MAG TPA: NADH-quinone oxidoreductase subunit G [Actinomycetota bacterium]|nr:NADH-quinone oxidoreductase subunit G [Actinomycetota bacterium]